MQKITPFLWYDTEADPERVQRVTKAMLQMVKLDIEALKQAYDG